MTPQYQFNLGQADPLLSIAQNNPEGYISVIEQELQKLNEVLDSNPFSFIIKPYISRVANNYIGKLDGLLKAIEDKDGKVDIEGILSESIDNLVVAQVKKYPNVFSGVEIGGGTIKINIPSFDKQLVFDYNDIETFKQNILN